MVGVLENKLIAFRVESKCCFVTGNALVGKGLENLLQGCLRNTVLLDAKITFCLLKPSKEPSDRLVVFWHSQLEELATVLKNLHFVEVTSEELENTKSKSLSSQELHQVAQSNFSIGIHLSFIDNISSHSVPSDLFDNHLVKACLLQMPFHLV